MAQQSWLDRTLEKIAAYIALWVPKRIARNVLMDLAMEAHDKDPSVGVLDMPFERMWDITFLKE